MIIDSFRKEQRWYEWLAFVAHWLWTGALLSFLPTWNERVQFYFIAASFQGILHFQLLFSHYCKPWYEYQEYKHKSWNVQQIESNMNIICPWYMDWFHGGLNFHIEHHLYPRLARNKLREASVKVRAVCLTHGIQYDETGFFDALKRTLKQLKQSSDHYSLDPR